MNQLIFGFALALASTACSSSATPVPPTAVATASAPIATFAALPANTIALTAADSGKTINAASGQVIAIRLKSNPSTGYRWKFIVEPERRVLELTSNDYIPDTLTPLPGSGGTDRWVYQVVGAGTTTLRLGSFPPANPNQPASIFEITVQAK